MLETKLKEVKEELRKAQLNTGGNSTSDMDVVAPAVPDIAVQKTCIDITKFSVQEGKVQVFPAPRCLVGHVSDG